MSRAPGALEGLLLGGSYRLGRLVGEGSMGAVYEGTQEGLGRPVAIKILKARGGVDTTALERFGREARAAAALGHPNIVQVTDFRPDADPPFLVMERLHGESLRAVISREKRLPVVRAALIVTQILDALSAAHRGGIVHRDIKPDNVFLTRIAGGTDMVKVLDFGVAKLTGDRPLTAHGALMGSPAYMAPEQATGRAVDARTDVWAVGATLYHALTGRLPFDASSLPELVTWLLERPPPPLGAVLPGIDARMIAVVDRALAKDPAGRFASAEEMQRALEPLLVAPQLTPQPSAPQVPFTTPLPAMFPPRPPSSPDPPPRLGAAPPHERPSSPGAPPHNVSRGSSPGAPPHDFSRGSSPGAPPHGQAQQRPGSSPEFSGHAARPGSSPDFPHGGAVLGGAFAGAVAPLGRPAPVGAPMAVGVAPPIAESEPHLAARGRAPSAPRLAAPTAPMAAPPRDVPRLTPLPSPAPAFARASYPGAPPPLAPPLVGRASAPEVRPPSGRGWLLLLVFPAFFALFVVAAVLVWLVVFRAGAAAPGAQVEPHASASAPAAPPEGPLAAGLPAGWKKKVDAARPCTALRLAPYENGKPGAFARIPDAEGAGLGSQLASRIAACAKPCPNGPTSEHYRVRVAYDGAVTEARPPNDTSKCDARDQCVDASMRIGKVDPPPGGEAMIEVVCTFP